MVLRNNAAYKAKELISVVDHVICDIDQTNLVVELIHMLGAFVDVAYTA